MEGARVMRAHNGPGMFGLAAFALIGVAGIAGFAGLATSPRAHSLRSAQPSAAAIVAARFPSGEFAPSQVAPSQVALSRVAPTEGATGFAPSDLAPSLWQGSFPAMSNPPDEGELFSPVPSYEAAGAAAATRAATARDGDPVADIARRRTAYRPRSVLNDAQIASIKERLNLTPEQEAMWPPIEVALRQISYVRNPAEPHRAPPSTARLAFIDPDSAEVRRLKYAALPLIMRLNEDQKREVNSLAHVMGLGKLASE
jgi:hypothetical protein